MDFSTSCYIALQCLKKKEHNKTLSAYILYIGTYAFLTFSFFLTIYYIFLAIYPHEDSITKFIPSLLPVVFIGFCTWIAKNIIFKMIDYEKEKQVGHSNENPHESKIVNTNEDNENTPLLSGNPVISYKKNQRMNELKYLTFM